MVSDTQEVLEMNANTKEVVYVSEAYEAITGRSLAEIRENPSSTKSCPPSGSRAIPYKIRRGRHHRKNSTKSSASYGQTERLR